MNNLFPIDPSNSTDMNDNTKVGTYSIDIEGDTDYVDGIEYLVSITDANIYTSTGKTVPISIDVTVDDLGDSNVNYFTAREDKDTLMYKKIIGDTIVGDGMLLVGYIPQNNPTGTPDGVDGSITIKAYLDKNKILISDTYDGTESDNMGTTNQEAEGKTVLTTTEWNALQSTGVSFKVKVEANEGIWVTGSLEEIMKTKNYSEALGRGIRDDESSTFVSSNSGINFGLFSSDTNGKGVYMRAGTQNDAYPILYYRGEIDDNNVVFNNKCWKAVRTTDTGGVKLIYNGELTNVYENVGLSENQYTIVTNTDGTNTNVWTFDSSDSSWNASYTTGSLELSFKVPAGDRYIFEIVGKNGSSGSGGYSIYKGTTSVTGGGGGGDEVFGLNYPYGTLTSDDIVKFYYAGGGFTTPSTFKIKMTAPGDLITSAGCDNTGTASQITVNNENTFAFNSGVTSPAYNGYMYGTEYTYNNGIVSGAWYSNSFTWDGTYYKLSDDASTSKGDTKHYSCGDTTKTATCASLRYYYYSNYYITLTGGDGVEEALVKMQTNTNDSIAKDKIETWYASQMTRVTDKLEDTIWCNDRSFGDGNNNGWIASGGSLTTHLYYGAYQRSALANNSSTVKNQPSLVCANKNDRFTWKNSVGNGALDYPVGLLTEDEIVLAGGGSGQGPYYLITGQPYWSLSPSSFFANIAGEFHLGENGSLSSVSVNYSSDSNNGLRPAISIKPGQLITKGTGTVADPYVIE